MLRQADMPEQERMPPQILLKECQPEYLPRVV